MADYWCIECGLPADIPLGPQPPDRACWICWACGGPVASEPQIALWNSPAIGALIDERIRQLHAGEFVTLAEFGPRVKFAVGAAADFLLMEALDRDE